RILNNAGEPVDKGRVRTKGGSAATISFTYPDIDSLDHLRLEAVFYTRDSARADLSLNLPPEKRKIELRATPEGGNLIAGIPAELVVQTHDQYNQPMAAQIQLMTKGDRVAAVRTDSRGAGLIKFIPERNKR